MSWLRRVLSMDRRPREGDVLPPESVATGQTEAVELARRAALEAGRAWREPLRTELIFHAGRPCWFVVTNAYSRGHRVTVVVDASSKDIVRIDEQPR
jgi:hypothetical protein